MQVRTRGVLVGKFEFLKVQANNAMQARYLHIYVGISASFLEIFFLNDKQKILVLKSYRYHTELYIIRFGNTVLLSKLTQTNPIRNSF